MNCHKCGLHSMENGAVWCFAKKKAVQPAENERCQYYIETRYDGDEPFTPSDHWYFLQSETDMKKMKNIRGLRL